MPIYEETYQSWDGQVQERAKTWWVIARTGIRLIWNKWMIVLLIFAYIPFLFKAAYLYSMTQFGEKIRAFQNVKALQIDSGFFSAFLHGQNFFLMLVIILSGAGLIANDRKFKALSIYFSKPVGFWDYIIGKFLVIVFYSSLITLAPALLLFVIQILLAKDAAFVNEYYWIPASFFGYFFLILITLGGLMLTISSVVRGTRSAAIFFFALITFPELFRKILSSIPEAGLISLNADIKQVVSVFFGLERPFQFSVWWSLAVLTGIVFLCLGILRVKVRPAEVVK